MEDSFYGPSFAILASLLCLQVFQCAFGFRRVRSLERRVWTLENTRQSSTSDQTVATATTVTTQPTYTYVQPPVYSYYQQPTAPSATYYSQDPQIVRGY